MNLADALDRIEAVGRGLYGDGIGWDLSLLGLRRHVEEEPA